MWKPVTSRKGVLSDFRLVTSRGEVTLEQYVEEWKNITDSVEASLVKSRTNQGRYIRISHRGDTVAVVDSLGENPPNLSSGFEIRRPKHSTYSVEYWRVVR